jgi:hypothetical protein
MTLPPSRTSRGWYSCYSRRRCDHRGCVRVHACRLVDDPVVLKKYHKTLAESYVNDNPLVKWCTSTPHCGNAGMLRSLLLNISFPSGFDLTRVLPNLYIVEVLWGKQVEVQCYCQHRYLTLQTAFVLTCL